MNHKKTIDMYSLASELFPLCRSITGKGNRQTLQRLQKDLPQLTIKSLVPEYKFYIRHYANMTVDTILYAVL